MKSGKKMEEKSASNVHINIYGGTNQILPNATKAEQHFYYRAEQPETPVPDAQPRPWTADDERRLSLYLEKEESLQAYIATLAACTTAQQAGEAVAEMCANEPKMDSELIVPPGKHQQCVAEPQKAAPETNYMIVVQVSNNKRQSIQ